MVYITKGGSIKQQLCVYFIEQCFIKKSQTLKEGIWLSMRGGLPEKKKLFPYEGSFGDLFLFYWQYDMVLIQTLHSVITLTYQVMHNLDGLEEGGLE